MDRVLEDEETRVSRLEESVAGIRSLLQGEEDEVAIMASLSCVLFGVMRQTSWLGFYRSTGGRTLKVGPYQGGLGCLSIPFGKGVCGTVAERGARLLVPDVHLFPGHIACDANSRSELVLPVYDANRTLLGVLDLDSSFPSAFCEREADLLQDILHWAFPSSRNFQRAIFE